MNSRQIIVIGGGVIGSAVAWRLAERGATVTVIDAGDRGSAASAGSLAWLNASSTTDPDYLRLRIAAMRGWQALAATPDCPVRFPGALLWEEGPDQCARQTEILNTAGWRAECIDRDRMRRLVPALSNPPEAALYLPEEGFADPRRIAGWFAARAKMAGACFHRGQVAQILTERGRIAGVRMGEETLTAQDVVVAAGIATTQLLASFDIGLAMDNRPGLLIRTTPLAPLAEPLLAAPEVHFWQSRDGTILAGSDYGGDLKGENPYAAARRILADLAALGPGFASAEIAATSMRLRPMPADGYPALGRVSTLEGLSIASMHSGMTLAPIAAEALAGEILDDLEHPLFAPYRPERAALNLSLSSKIG